MKISKSPPGSLASTLLVSTTRAEQLSRSLMPRVVAVCWFAMVSGCSGDETDGAEASTTAPNEPVPGVTSGAPTNTAVQPAGSGSGVTVPGGSSTNNTVAPNLSPPASAPEVTPTIPTTEPTTSSAVDPTGPVATMPGDTDASGMTGDVAAMPSNTSEPSTSLDMTDASSAEDAGGMPQQNPDQMPTGTVCSTDPGTAPSGNLSLIRIDAVNPTDNGFHLYEGAAWLDGGLYFSDINPNRQNEQGTQEWYSTIRRYDPSSGTATDFLMGAGSNGLAVDASGVLHSATSAKREISKYDLATAMQQRVIGDMLNSPNDLAIASDGTIYFSDPQQGEIRPAGNQPQVVHVVKDGVDAVFTDQIQGPNGVTLSPDESVLYVAGGNFFVKKVTLVDGLAGEIEDLVTGLSTPDGMTKDCAGNLYIAEHSGRRIVVVSPDGTEIASMSLSESPTNVAFGGNDRKTLFVTAINSLWQVDLDIEGYPY